MFTSSNPVCYKNVVTRQWSFWMSLHSEHYFLCSVQPCLPSPIHFDNQSFYLTFVWMPIACHYPSKYKYMGSKINGLQRQYLILVQLQLSTGTECLCHTGRMVIKENTVFCIYKMRQEWSLMFWHILHPVALWYSLSLFVPWFESCSDVSRHCTLQRHW